MHDTSWNLAQRISFRFLSAFFLIYFLGGLIFSILIFRPFISWFAAQVLRLENPITVFTNGSGDTTYDYVCMLVYLLLACLGTVIWTMLDRKNCNYNRSLYWVSMVLRYFLAMNMLSYGFSKVFHLQMPSPYLYQLIQPLGDKSPMGLAWTYFGFSKGFSFFTGFAEVMAGLLLLFRRTALMGALFTAAISINIVAINLCFDVPVKLFSSVLFLMSLFLLAADGDRLLNFFVFNRVAPAKDEQPYIRRKGWQIVRLILKSLFIAFLLFEGLVQNGIYRRKAYGDLRKKTPLYGMYDTDLVMKNGDTILPLTTDASRWRTLIIEREQVASIKMMNDSIKYVSFVIDTAAKSILLKEDTLRRGELSYIREPGSLILKGRIQEDSVFMRLKERDIQSFRLINRGFHWVNEYPYNR